MKSRRIAVAAFAVMPLLLGALLAPALLGKQRIEKEYDPEIDPADFVSVVDNPWWPLTPLTTFVYETEDGEERNEVRVTTDTKTILGVTCTVVEDLAWEDGLLVEKTVDWYAQDEDGNVWYFGEASEAYEYDEDGNLVDTSTEGSWEAGVDGARPGIVMLADPRPGDRYRQEYLEDEAEDMALVLRRNAKVEIDLGEFTCLQTKEWTPLEPGHVEQKFYAKGTGLVLVKELHGGTKRVELVEIVTP